MSRDVQEHVNKGDDGSLAASKTAKHHQAVLAESTTINCRAAELYAFWRDPSNLSRVMENVTSIEVIDRDRSRWSVKAPGGMHVSWESIITHDVPGRSIAWQSAPGSEIWNCGEIEFLDLPERGTVVRVNIAYDPPLGAVGQLLAKLFQREPRIQARRDLRRFKQVMETGEIATAARTRAQLEKEKA